MKRLFGLVTLFICLSSLFSNVNEARSEEQKSPFSLDTSVGYFSDYMFRGFNLYDGTSIQPSVGLAYETEFGTFGVSEWMHISGENGGTHENFTELDSTLRYSIPVGPVTLSTGHLWYAYPNNTHHLASTNEVFASVAYDAPLSPTFTFYYDYKDLNYAFYELGFSHTIENDCLGNGFNVTPYVTFGFASSADGVYQDNGLETVNTGLSFDMALGDFAVTPTLNYTFKVDENTVNEFWVGMTVGYSF